MKTLSRLSIVLLPVMLFAGCESLGTQEGATVEDRGTIAEGAEGAEGAQARGARAGTAFEGHPLEDPASLLSQRVIYFDFDSSKVADDFVELVKHHGRYLSANPSASIRLEGHTDERGTREYNIALGDRRAQAVKRLLMFQGASSDQVTIISYGEEKPASLGHDESTWHLNRRAELVYQ